MDLNGDLARDVIDLTSPTPSFELPPQDSEVARPAQQTGHSLGHSQLDTTKITMSSEKPFLFRPPAFTQDLFNDYIDEDDEPVDEEPQVSVSSSTLKSDSRTLLPGFYTPENSSRGTPSSDDTVQEGLFVKTENGHDELNDDDELGVFARGFRRPKHNRKKAKIPFAIPRVPTLTQQGHRLPKHLRTGYRRSNQDIVMGRESYADYAYTPAPAPAPSRQVQTPTYARVHSTSLPSTNLIPTGGGGYIVANSFMTSTHRKRLEQREKIDKLLTDLEEYLAECPTDIKARAKLLHIESLQHRLEENEHLILKGGDAAIIRDVEKMVQRRRMNMVKAEFESQARAMVESMSSAATVVPAGTTERKRAYDRAMGPLSPLSSSWSETVVQSSEGSSFSPSYHPTTGGKTVGQAYYQQRKRARTTSDLEGGADADGERDEAEDAVYDDGQERKTYGGKTIAVENAAPLSDFDMAAILKEAVDEEETKDEGMEEDSGDDIDESSDSDTDDERGTDAKGKEDRKGNNDNAAKNEEEMDEEDDTDDKGTGENGNDETQKEAETEEDGGNGEANE